MHGWSHTPGSSPCPGRRQNGSPGPRAGDRLPSAGRFGRSLQEATRQHGCGERAGSTSLERSRGTSGRWPRRVRGQVVEEGMGTGWAPLQGRAAGRWRCGPGREADARSALLPSRALRWSGGRGSHLRSQVTASSWEGPPLTGLRRATQRNGPRGRGLRSSCSCGLLFLGSPISERAPGCSGASVAVLRLRGSDGTELPSWLEANFREVPPPRATCVGHLRAETEITGAGREG